MIHSHQHISASPKLLINLRGISGGRGIALTHTHTSKNACHAHGTNQLNANRTASFPPCRCRNVLGILSLWISSPTCRKPQTKMMPSLSLLTGSPKWHISSLAQSPAQPSRQQTSSFRMSIDCTAVLPASWWTETHDGGAASGRLGAHCSMSVLACHQLFIHSLTDKLRG